MMSDSLSHSCPTCPNPECDKGLVYDGHAGPNNKYTDKWSQYGTGKLAGKGPQ